MVEYAATIVVEDASGARFQLYEYRGMRLFKRVRKFVLDSGEPVTRVDADTFEVAATGESLVRVRPFLGDPGAAAALPAAKL